MAWEQFKEYVLIPFDKQLLSIAPEIGHLAPVILTVGTALVSLFTLNKSLAVFAASSLEAHILYKIAKVLGNFFITPVLGIISSPSDNSACQSYFQKLSASRFNWFMEQGIKINFPNQPLYWISFASAYLIHSMKYFSKETSELGPQYNNRPYLAMIGAIMFLALYATYLFAYGCDNVFTLLSSIAIGLFVGIMISTQNYLLFDKPAINVMFIPPLANRSGMDYVCVSSSNSTKP
jgi:hypothetical protein